VHTCSHIIEKMETPGSRLQKEWGHLMAPDIAKTYWRMADDATWLDVIKQIMADEANHRDVNHTFASLKSNEVNPYVTRSFIFIDKGKILFGFQELKKSSGTS